MARSGNLHRMTPLKMTRISRDGAGHAQQFQALRIWVDSKC